MSKNKGGRQVKEHTKVILWIIKNEKEARNVFVEGNLFKIPNSKEIQDLIISHKKMEPFDLTARVISQTIVRYKESLKAHFEELLKRDLEFAATGKKDVVLNHPTLLDHDLECSEDIFPENLPHEELDTLKQQKNVIYEPLPDQTKLHASPPTFPELRKNFFTTKIDNRTWQFKNLCPINSVIHSFMHFHAHLKNLDARDSEFYNLVLQLFKVSFDEGNELIGKFILKFKLYSEIKGNTVDGYEHVENIVDRIPIPSSASLRCYLCNMKLNKKKISLAFDEAVELQEGLSIIFSRAIRGFCNCKGINLVSPQFNSIVHLEITDFDNMSKIPIGDIMQTISYNHKFHFACAIHCSNGHFYSVGLKNDGSFVCYNDIKSKPEDIDAKKYINPQHLIFFD